MNYIYGPAAMDMYYTPAGQSQLWNLVNATVPKVRHLNRYVLFLRAYLNKNFNELFCACARSVIPDSDHYPM